MTMLAALFAMLASAQQDRRQGWMEPRTLPRDSIRMSDPCILADYATRTYYMTGTGGMLWKSKDLNTWTGPYRVAETDPQSWMGPRPQI